MKVDGVEQTTFMLAVQETNFLLSFTMSAFSALATALTSIGENDVEADELDNLYLLLGVSITYAILGFLISVFLYGRKTSHNPEDLNKRTSIYKQAKAVP